ncbi:MAG TPA: replicative DNA helicase [Candidatus Acidoferrales bacterium]|nr:replicative DNA helicase [Candidatus Acidoferrales bacterium]
MSTLPLPGRGEGRVPPHDLEAESSVLGAVLLDPAAITRVLESLNAEDFYRENHAEIYRAAIELFREGEPIDSVTLAAQLEKQGVLERVGGRAQLAMLQEAVPTAANVEHYARIVKARAQKRRLITAGSQVTGLGYDDSLDADDAVNQAQATVYAVSDDRTGSDLARLYDLLKPAMDRIDAQMASHGGVVGIPTGFGELDRMMNGLKPSDLIIVAGRPSMGKTSWVLNVALNAAVNEHRGVAIFSLEMSKEQLVERMLCEQAQIDAQRLHRGMLSDPEYDRLARALGPLGDAPIFIDDSPMLDDLTLRLKARQVKTREKVDLIIVDYLQLMHGRSRSDDSNRVQEVSAISRGLKTIARELKLPVIAISQLSRGPENRPDKRPLLSDLRESGCLGVETPVYLPDLQSSVAIGNLVGRTGFRVLGIDEYSRRLVPAEVTNAFCSGTKPLFRLRSRAGLTIRASSNHRFLVPGGWRRLDQLCGGDRIAVVAHSASSAALTKVVVGAPSGRTATLSPALAAIWDRVESIEPAGEEEVFDLTVARAHSFVAGDMVVHNSIEQDADLVMFLYRDDYYNREKSEKPGVAEIIVAKHRNGPTGVVELMFRKELTRFENLERRRPTLDP